MTALSKTTTAFPRVDLNQRLIPFTVSSTAAIRAINHEYSVRPENLVPKIIKLCFLTSFHFDKNKFTQKNSENNFMGKRLTRRWTLTDHAKMDNTAPSKFTQKVRKFL